MAVRSEVGPDLVEGVEAPSVQGSGLLGLILIGAVIEIWEERKG
jgi:hypothetical protein